MALSQRDNKNHLLTCQGDGLGKGFVEQQKKREYYLSLLHIPPAPRCFPAFPSGCSAGSPGKGWVVPHTLGFGGLFSTPKCPKPFQAIKKFGELALESGKFLQCLWDAGLSFIRFMEPLGSKFWESQLQETLLYHALTGRSWFFFPSLSHFILKIPFFELFLAPLSCRG